MIADGLRINKRLRLWVLAFARTTRMWRVSRIQISNSAAVKYDFAISRRIAPEVWRKSFAL
jgi:hypothetical protein